MNIYEAIADIMKEGYSISKNKYNNQQKFAYRGIDDVMNVFQPLMAERGIFIVPEVIEQRREERLSSKNNNLIYSVLKMKYTFYASDGTSISATVIGEGMDSGDKASNKAMAVAMKYAMFQVFCIPTEEMGNCDPDGTSPAVQQKTQRGATPPQQAQQPATSKCDNCKKDIMPIRRSDGSILTVEQIIYGSRKSYNKTLCYACMKAEKKAREAAQQQKAEEAAAQYQQDAMNMNQYGEQYETEY